MRRLLLILFLAIANAAIAADDAALADFARRVGLVDAAGFFATVRELGRAGKLPDRYVTKTAAEKLGWRPGGDLCKSAPGKALGGDTFFNREARLPQKPGRRYREADLDYDCGKRGPARLVYSNDGLRFVTVDHYRTFHEVPP